MTNKKTQTSATKKVAKKASPKTAGTKKPGTKAAGTKAAGTKAAGIRKTPAKHAAADEMETKGAESVKKPENKASVARSSSALNEKKSAPIVFSLDDAEALVASRKNQEPETAEESAPAKRPVATKKIIVDAPDQPVEKRKLGAASLADILGFNPAEKKSGTQLEDDDIPKKWKKFYKLLVELRHHVRDELDLHTADTLKHSSREDSGDLSNYGNHQADAGTDAFDRDFALSLVSSEQDALNEVEEAILRIKNGTYGICEVTGQPINKERLEAVPFARFSVEGQAEYEKNRRRKIDRSAGGLFGDAIDTPKLASDDDDEE